MVDMGALQASAYLDGTGRTERDLAEVAARSRTRGADNPHAVVSEKVDADELLGRPVTHRPLRDADVAPVTDGAAAIVIAADGLARELREHPAWIRSIEHRIDPQHLGVRDLTTAPSAAAAAAAAGVARDGFDVAELHTQFSHEELILRDALGLADHVDVNPSGGPLVANPVMSTGLIRIGEVANRIFAGSVTKGLAHAAQGPCLQQNLVCVLEGGN
jgi:acetyl-CoA acetyltransferase